MPSPPGLAVRALPAGHEDRSQDQLAILLADAGRDEGTLDERFARARLLPGRVLPLAKATRAQGELQRRFDFAMSLQREHLLDLALVEFQDIAQLSPQDGVAHNNLGSLLAQTGDKTGAAGAFRTALALRPPDLSVRFEDWFELHLSLSQGLLGYIVKSTQVPSKSLSFRHQHSETQSAGGRLSGNRG